MTTSRLKVRRGAGRCAEAGAPGARGAAANLSRPPRAGRGVRTQRRCPMHSSRWMGRPAAQRAARAGGASPARRRPGAGAVPTCTAAESTGPTPHSSGHGSRLATSPACDCVLGGAQQARGSASCGGCRSGAPPEPSTAAPSRRPRSRPPPPPPRSSGCAHALHQAAARVHHMPPPPCWPSLPRMLAVIFARPSRVRAACCVKLTPRPPALNRFGAACSTGAGGGGGGCRGRVGQQKDDPAAAGPAQWRRPPTRYKAAPSGPPGAASSALQQSAPPPRPHTALHQMLPPRQPAPPPPLRVHAPWPRQAPPGRRRCRRRRRRRRRPADPKSCPSTP